MSNGFLIAISIVLATVAGAGIALYIAGRRGMRRRTLDERPIIVNPQPAPTVIVPITEVSGSLPVLPGSVPA